MLRFLFCQRSGDGHQTSSVSERERGEVRKRGGGRERAGGREREEGLVLGLEACTTCTQFISLVQSEV